MKQCFARLKPLVEDFRIYWDNAYCIHDLYDAPQNYLKEILKECEKVGNPELVYIFMSTSKMNFSGAGIAAIAASENNLKGIRTLLSAYTIGYDKLNQLQHVMYL